jgi:hypothetical protein
LASSIERHWSTKNFRLERWSVHLASEDRRLVAQHDDFNGEIGVTATDETD